MQKQKMLTVNPMYFLVGCAAVIIFAFLLAHHTVTQVVYPTEIPEPSDTHIDSFQRTKQSTSYTSFITGYNAVPEQTDSTPCLFADGKDHCHTIFNIHKGTDITVACPYSMSFGTMIHIEQIGFGCCRDRMHIRHDGKFDVLVPTVDDARAITGHKTVTVWEESRCTTQH